jgi:hypothetical protein
MSDADGIAGLVPGARSRHGELRPVRQMDPAGP